MGAIPYVITIDTILSENALKFLFTFVATIVALVIKPMAAGACALLAVSSLNISGILTAQESLAGFSQSVVWLVVFSLAIAKAIAHSGLGQRAAFFFIKIFGKTPIGLAYSLSITDALLAPGMPSVTGRSAGIIMPIIQGISKLSRNSKSITSYLILTSYHTTVVTSAMFLTAMAANPLVQEIAGNLGINITWVLWAKAGLVPGLMCLFVIPFVVRLFNPVKIKSMVHVTQRVRKELESLGPLTKKEIFVSLTIVLLVALWMFGDIFNIPTVVTSLLGLNLLLISGSLDWEEFVESKEMWNVFIWFSVVVMMASKLDGFGIIDWFSNNTTFLITGLEWKFGFALILAIYFYSHYFFASATAHVAAMYLPFLAMGIKLGVPKIICALSLGFASSLFGCLTHFGLSTGPILFGLGYVSTKKWWKIGFIMSLVHMVIWGIIGPIWWSYLNLY